MIVFVHGVPETAALWNTVRALIDRESVALSMPGFGCPRPDGFGATKDDYAAWLISELEAIGEPVDLVGHDWGAILTYRVATTRADLLRSWAADIGNTVHPDYVWHAFAQIWQTPGDGEAFFETQQTQPVEGRAQGYVGLGIPLEDATVMAEAGDLTMGSCILDLYRSALPNPYASWGADFGPTGVPGLVVSPTNDPFGEDAKAREVATILGAEFDSFEAGHFWPVENPQPGVDVLQRFWSKLS